MEARDLMDDIRGVWVSDSSLSPTRSVGYTRTNDDVSVTINAFVGGGNFTVKEKETIDNWEVFGGLALTVAPEVNDTVTYNGQTWKVKRHTRMGNLFAVYGYQKRHNGRPKG